MRTIAIFLTVFALNVSGAFAQTESKAYVSSAGEMIFSFANVSQNGVDKSSLMRWAPVINLQSTLNRDFSQNVGVFTGLAMRNVGYIMDDYTSQDINDNGAVFKKKFRSYNVGVPFGIKIGNLDNMFIYGGYEIELPFLYKEKTFINDTKENKINEWFSNRQEMFQQSFFAGIQFPYGMNLKFKYYISEFHNQGYKTSNGVTPYAGLKSNVFYFSLSYFMFNKMNL
jgi:hypothetical protein